MARDVYALRLMVEDAAETLDEQAVRQYEPSPYEYDPENGDEYKQ